MLHIIANTRFFLTDFVMERLRDTASVRVLAHDSRRRGALKSLAKLVESYLPLQADQSLYFAPDYLKQLQAIAPTDSVLIFGIENLKELRILRRFIRARRCSIFTWNPVQDYQQNAALRLLHIRALKSLGMKVYTFDPEDARRHDLTLVPQVYRDVAPYIQTQVSPDIDLYFVGQDKGRLPTLQGILHAAQQAGLRTHFHVTPDKGRTYSAAEKSLLASSSISYAENLALINRAHCLVEVAQPHQSGPTVRSLEAAFFGKKLLTTRASAAQDTWFSPDRVFIAPEAVSQLGTWIKQPLPALEAALLQPHDMLHWCRQFD
jgi:hypothetical protein